MAGLLDEDTPTDSATSFQCAVSPLVTTTEYPSALLNSLTAASRLRQPFPHQLNELTNL